MVSAFFENVKFWRNLCIPLAAMLGLAGGLTAWLAYAFMSEVLPIELAALENAGDQLNIDPKADPVTSRDSFDSLVYSDFDKWILAARVSSITVTILLAIGWAINQVWAVKQVHEARRKCVNAARKSDALARIQRGIQRSDEEGKLELEEFMRRDPSFELQEAQNAGGFVKYYYIIFTGILVASFLLACVMLGWAVKNFLNTEDGKNDYFFFMLMVIGLSLAVGGHIIGIAINAWLATVTLEICTKDKIITLAKMSTAKQEDYVNGFAGMDGDGGSTRNLRRRRRGIRRSNTRRSSLDYERGRY